MTLLEINNPPGNCTANILVTVKMMQWTKARTTAFPNRAIHLLYLSSGFQNEKPWGERVEGGRT